MGAFPSVRPGYPDKDLTLENHTNTFTKSYTTAQASEASEHLYRASIAFLAST